MSTATDNRKLWLEERRKTIGASDTYKILGMAPFGNPVDLERKLWLDKMGLNADEDSQAIRMGQFLQHGVAMEALTRIGGAIEQEEPFAIHPVEQWASATPDYILRIGDRQAILEVKVTSRDPWEIVPEAYVIQVHWQCWVHNIDVAYVAALHGSTEVRIYEIPVNLNSKWFSEIRERCGEWYRRHMVNGEEPLMVNEYRSKAMAEAIRAESGKVEVLDDLEFDIRAMLEAKAQAKELSDRITEIEARIKEKMGSAEVGTLRGVPVVTWKESVSKSFDSTKAKESLGGDASKFVVERVSRRFLVKEKALA
jgi:putative phage-type endonuclease